MPESFIFTWFREPGGFWWFPSQKKCISLKLTWFKWIMWNYVVLLIVSEMSRLFRPSAKCCASPMFLRCFGGSFPWKWGNGVNWVKMGEFLPFSWKWWNYGHFHHFWAPGAPGAPGGPRGAGPGRIPKGTSRRSGLAGGGGIFHSLLALLISSSRTLLHWSSPPLYLLVRDRIISHRI